MRWLNKHSNDPLSAGKRWIVERYQFGIAMFDPPDLSARYKRLIEWQGGKWVNYWTQSVPRAKIFSGPSESGSLSSEWTDNDSALVLNGMVSRPEDKSNSVSGELILLSLTQCSLQLDGS